MITGYTNSLPTDVLLDAGVLFVGAAAIGASTGGLKFDPKATRKQIAFDGMRAPIAGNDRTTKWESVFTGKFLQLAAAQIIELEQDVTSASVTGGVSYIPTKAGVLYSVGTYVSNVRLIFERGGSTVGSPLYAAVLFKKALCTKYDITSKDESEVEVNAEFAARLDVIGGASIQDCPFTIELRTALP